MESDIKVPREMQNLREVINCKVIVLVWKKTYDAHISGILLQLGAHLARIHSNEIHHVSLTLNV